MLLGRSLNDDFLLERHLAPLVAIERLFSADHNLSLMIDMRRAKPYLS